MATTPKLVPNLFIRNKHNPLFKSTSALVLNSLFKQYKPRLANAPELNTTMQPDKHMDTQPHFMMDPARNNDFFNSQHVAKGAVGIGDLATALASGNLSLDMDNDDAQQGQANHPGFFSRQNKLEPHSPRRRKELEKKALEKAYQEELERRRRRQPGRS